MCRDAIKQVDVLILQLTLRCTGMSVLDLPPQAASIHPHYSHVERLYFPLARTSPSPVHSAALASPVNCGPHFISGPEGTERRERVSATSSCPDTKGAGASTRGPQMSTSLGLGNHGASPSGRSHLWEPLMFLQLSTHRHLRMCDRAYTCICINLHAYTHIYIYQYMTILPIDLR